MNRLNYKFNSDKLLITAYRRFFVIKFELLKREFEH